MKKRSEQRILPSSGAYAQLLLDILKTLEEIREGLEEKTE